MFYGSWLIDGIQYDHIADDSSTLLRWYVIPIAVGTVTVIILVTAFGWWRPVLTDRTRLPSGWIAVPGLMAVAAVATLLTNDTSSISVSMWVWLIVGSLLVGFNEETINRGVLVVAFRARFGEVGVWLLSSLCFALMHVPNWFFGEGSVAVLQAFFAFLSGTTFYLLRRTSGSLILAMLLHALWDFASFAGDGRLGLQGLAAPLLGAIAVIAVVVLGTRRRRKRSVL